LLHAAKAVRAVEQADPENLPVAQRAQPAAPIDLLLCLVMLALPEAAAKIFVLPAFILSGLFWAALIEMFLVVKNARRGIAERFR
jgi:hypothetical protein